jgi:hypothetical protein
VAEFSAFIRGLIKNWQALLLGGVVAVALTLWQWFGSPLSRIWYGVILLLTFLAAAYLTWRTEYRRANKAESELEDLKKAARIASEKGDPAIWKPRAALQSQDNGAELRNELVLKDSNCFALLSVALLSPQGAKLADIRTDQNIVSTGFSVQITQADILKLWNRNFRSGSIEYTVRQDTSYTGTIRFEAEIVVIRNTDWIRLVG